MHMRIDATREREPILGVKDLAGEIGLNFRPEPSDLSILDRNIKTIDRGLVRSNHSGVLDDGIELFIHARRSFAYWRSLRIAPVGAASRAVTFLAIRRDRRFILFAERDQCRCADYVIKSSEVIHSIKERFGGTMGGK